MTIKQTLEIETCETPSEEGVICKSTDFSKVKSDNKEINLRKCKKCGNVSDLALRSEDEKHNAYHETGGEPQHEDITKETTKEKKMSDIK